MVLIRLNTHYLRRVFTYSFFFFFNDTATTEIYTLSLHDALPISGRLAWIFWRFTKIQPSAPSRSEEHTSELQSRRDLVCRLLLEKKKNGLHLLGEVRAEHAVLEQPRRLAGRARRAFSAALEPLRPLPFFF